MKINDILKKCTTKYTLINENNIYVKGITDSSQNVKKNFIFFAINGQFFNGEDFINSICHIENIIILLSSNCDFRKKITNKNILKITLIQTKDLNKLAGEISSIFYESNIKEKIAITGTNGKTSVTSYINQIWRKLNHNSASIGTLGFFYNNSPIASTLLTTPNPINLHKNLRKLTKKSCSRMVIEASSIGLEQDRLYPLKFDKIAFTNLSRDHLDYHKNINNYRNSKLKLFNNYTKKKSIAVINSDNKYSNYFYNSCMANKIKVLDYGKKADFLKIITTQNNIDILETKFLLKKKKYSFDFNSNTTFEIYNMICALILVFGKKLSIEDFKVINKIKNPEGRLEKIFNGIFKVFVDYAHTPDALRNVLESLNKIKKNRIVCVIGCGGDRDKGKRPLMTKQALLFSDAVIITDDNPRYENPKKIRNEMVEKVSKDDLSKIKSIGDREKAIKYAISIMDEKDILLIAGKGHEKYQFIKDKKIFFSDKKVTLKIIKENGILDS